MRLAVKVPKQRAEEARRHVIKLSLYDYSRRVVRDGDYVLIPVLGKPGPEYEVVEADLPPATMKKLPELRSSYDILGSVAVINDLNMSLERAAVVAGEIMARHSAVKTVLLKRGEVSGDERVARYVVVAGEPVTETLYRESGMFIQAGPYQGFFQPAARGREATGCFTDWPRRESAGYVRGCRPLFHSDSTQTSQRNRLRRGEEP
jgi:tRNA (guanine37-N1)-methyltransferase